MWYYCFCLFVCFCLVNLSRNIWQCQVTQSILAPAFVKLKEFPGENELEGREASEKWRFRGRETYIKIESLPLSSRRESSSETDKPTDAASRAEKEEMEVVQKKIDAPIEDFRKIKSSHALDMRTAVRKSVELSSRSFTIHKLTEEFRRISSTERSAK
jgi:hypothetical protein